MMLPHNLDGLTLNSLVKKSSVKYRTLFLSSTKYDTSYLIKALFFQWTLLIFLEAYLTIVHQGENLLFSLFFSTFV